MNFSPPWLSWPETQELVAAFNARKGALRFVGGAVRDALLGRDVSDVDAASSVLPDAMLAVLAQAGIRAIPTGIAHGTITALVGQRRFEITTLRKDVACDGRHAEVVFTDSWKEDAARRDFTMNALYLNPEGELFDYFGGMEDAQAGRVRFIGDAAQRIREDYLRVLRFFRFYAHYGQGAADAAALAACAGAVGHLGGLSGERVQAELLKLLAAPTAGEVLLIMQREGVLSATLGIEADADYIARLNKVEQMAAMALPNAFRLVGLVWHNAALWDLLSVRLRLAGKLDKAARLLLQHREAISEQMDVAAQKHLLRTLGMELFMALVLLSATRHGYRPVYGQMLQLAHSWPMPVFPVSGDDLIKAGIAPGKPLGDTLKKLELLWEQSDYTLDVAALLSLLPKG